MCFRSKSYGFIPISQRHFKYLEWRFFVFLIVVRERNIIDFGKTKRMRFFIIVVLLSISYGLNAQHFEGRCVSKNDRVPLPYANVFFVKNNVGTITDEDGYFEFDSVLLADDTVVISYVGYDVFICAVSKLDTLVTLASYSVTLDEVMVHYDNPAQLIKRAREMLSINYPLALKRYLLSVHHLIESDSAILSVFEGNVIGSIKGYVKKQPSEYRLFDYDAFWNNRKTVDYTISYKSDAFPVNLISQLYVGKLDFIENTDCYIYSKDVGDSVCYCICFRPNVVDSKHPYSGIVKIDKKDFAIVYIEYGVVDEGLLVQKDVTIDIGRFSKSVEYHSVDSSVTRLQFSKQNGKYHLSHFYNECYFTHTAPDGKKSRYVAKNDVVNCFGSFGDITMYRPISLSFEDLNEWRYDEIKHDKNFATKYHSKKIRKIIESLKDKYPDVDFSEMLEDSN